MDMREIVKMLARLVDALQKKERLAYPPRDIWTDTVTSRDLELWALDGRIRGLVLEAKSILKELLPASADADPLTGVTYGDLT